jgi:lipoprotein-releasing system ATP-binding protein
MVGRMIIRLENLGKSYELNKSVEVKALKNVNLNIQPGEIVSIVGPSGAGKSTLLHLIGLMEKPSSGSIYLDEKDCSSLSEGEYAKIRRKKIGFLFQMHYLLPDFTVLENILLPAWNEREKKTEFAMSMVRQLGLETRIEHMPSELSGGEQQRVALCRALINEPEILLADEPTGDLDRETGEKVEDIIFSQSRNKHMTLILVTHNAELAQKTGRTIKMRDGVLQ